MANLGNCAPPGMNYDEFLNIVGEKSLLYTESSTEDKFLETVSHVIQYNYLLYDEIFGYINDLTSEETELYQFEHLIEHVPMNRSYPFQLYFDQFVRDKESLKEKLNVLLGKIGPAYKFNEQFLKVFSKMDANTKIDSNLYKKLSKEAGIVIEINKSIDKLFEHLQMIKYKTILETQRKSTMRLQSKERGFGLDKADESTNELIEKETKLFPKMMNILDEALKLDFKTLVGSTKRFYDLFNKSINCQPATCAASSSKRVNNRNRKFPKPIHLKRNLSMK